MPSRGCSYDNAAMENFFGTLKPKYLYRAWYSTRTEVEELIAQYIHFYNFGRIHLKNGLTPYKIWSKVVYSLDILRQTLIFLSAGQGTIQP